jgi:uncharacterized protein YdcH (DUF465 family)
MEKHDLHNEIPQFEDKIHEMKTNDTHFRKLFDEYEDLNHKIHGVESTGLFTDDELNEMRSRRLHLKDELYDILKG